MDDDEITAKSVLSLLETARSLATYAQGLFEAAAEETDEISQAIFIKVAMSSLECADKTTRLARMQRDALQAAKNARLS